MQYKLRHQHRLGVVSCQPSQHVQSQMATCMQYQTVESHEVNHRSTVKLTFRVAAWVTMPGIMTSWETCDDCIQRAIDRQATGCKDVGHDEE